MQLEIQQLQKQLETQKALQQQDLQREKQKIIQQCQLELDEILSDREAKIAKLQSQISI